ncbi:AraC family transcriptional regulator [Thiorhodovibrio frisius]|uniref:DNA-binding domain-containing protein, AraC-type n=1 Tax=Thiorhodovibrio frisius TaxID=631362 RepID=H8YW75_9GAMM|nr:AraC family transcriptional regulator [Thiorhodovibrio frisius]EIC23866.1 DNA-binding domain-containing protein, AraC-type [Thiorhodovibrio frisius]WPL23224.1 Virulence-regulating protein VirS [Thiorhodovibrio frisius]
MTRRPTEPTHAETELRIGATMALPAVLRSLGANPEEVLAEAGFDLGLFDNPDNRISYAARSRLLAHCVDSTDCQHLGLLVGQQAGLHSLGLMGLLVKYSPDVGTALRSLVRFLHLHVRGAVVNLEVDGDLAILSYEIYEPGAVATDQIGDGAVAAMVNILRTLCGPAWKPSEVRFAHREPDGIRPFRSFFGAPLFFDTARNAVVFPARWLTQRLSGTDPDLLRLPQKQIEALEVRYGDDLPGQVRRVLRTSLLMDQARSNQVAKLFSIHSRTLSRRLNARGTSFQELLDEGRFEIARQMLENTRMAVHQIAETLDYADASAFTRAFRRWSGITPGQWRKNHKVARSCRT